MMHHETGCEASAKHPDLFVAIRGLAEKSLQVLCLFFALFGRTLATRIYLGSAGLLRHGEKMITLRAIKGTAPSECRYHRYGETYDFCTWRPSRVVTAFAKHQIGFKRMLSNLAQSARLTVRAWFLNLLLALFMA